MISLAKISMILFATTQLMVDQSDERQALMELVTQMMVLLQTWSLQL